MEWLDKKVWSSNNNANSLFAELEPVKQTIYDILWNNEFIGSIRSTIDEINKLRQAWRREDAKKKIDQLKDSIQAARAIWVKIIEYIELVANYSVQNNISFNELQNTLPIIYATELSELLPDEYKKEFENKFTRYKLEQAYREDLIKKDSSEILHEFFPWIENENVSAVITSTSLDLYPSSAIVFGKMFGKKYIYSALSNGWFSKYFEGTSINVINPLRLAKSKAWTIEHEQQHSRYRHISINNDSIKIADEEIMLLETWSLQDFMEIVRKLLQFFYNLALEHAKDEVLAYSLNSRKIPSTNYLLSFPFNFITNSYFYTKEIEEYLIGKSKERWGNKKQVQELIKKWQLQYNTIVSSMIKHVWVHPTQKNIDKISLTSIKYMNIDGRRKVIL